jgi:tRNA nucleotidyltransferase (CCA-adding enzyme)
LKNGVIKAVGNPKIRFKEYPLRILRAVRFAASLGFEIEPKTWDKLCKMRFDLLKISKERWVLEIDKILSLENPEKLEKGLEMLMESGVFGVIIPELILQKNYNQNSPYHNFDLWTHTKKVVCNVPFEDLDLKWTALLHDIAKPFVRTENKNGNSNYINHDILGSQMSLKVSSYLKFSNLRKDFIFENILNHLQSESKLKIYDDLGKK